MKYRGKNYIPYIGVGEGGARGANAPPYFSERGGMAPPLFKICDVAGSRVLKKKYNGKSEWKNSQTTTITNACILSDSRVRSAMNSNNTYKQMLPVVRKLLCLYILDGACNVDL